MRILAKRIISIALALCLCLTMLPTVATQVVAADPISMMVSWAQERVGKSGQQLGYNTEWCAYFVSDCAVYADQARAIPYNGNAHYLYFAVLDAGGKIVSSPQAGDLVFYNCIACDTNGDGISMMHVGLVENGNYSIEGNLDGSSYSTRIAKRKGLNERYSHGSGHSTDNYVKRVYVRPNYSGGSHNCNKGTYVYYEAAHPHYKCYECSICGNVWRNTEEPTIIDSCSACVQPKTIDDRYSSFFPIAAFPLATGHINVYDVAGNQLSNRYIDGATDVCIILEVYTDGWCKVRYPSSAEESGYFDAYVPFSTFTESTYPSWWTAPMDYTTYRRSDLASEMHIVSSGEDCMLLITSGSVKQIIHPVRGQDYSMMGWISVPEAEVKPTIRAWTSESAMGEKASEYKVGNRYYLCYELTDAVSGLPLDDVREYSYSVKLTILLPDGSVGYTYSYTNDDNWISLFIEEPGKYTYTVEITGDFSFLNSLTRTMEENPKKIYASTTEVDLTIGGTASEVVYIWTTGYNKGKTAVTWSTSNSNIECAWGEWNEDNMLPLTITAISPGSSTIILSVKDNETGEVLDSYTVNVTVSSKTYTVSYDANGGKGAPESQTKYHNTVLVLSNTKPTQFGYTFLGWSASPSAVSPSYKPGSTFTSNANTTLYAVWKIGCDNDSHLYWPSFTTPTCTAAGYITYTCTFCGYSYAEIYMDATGHNYTSVVTPPTCTEQGYTTYTCTECGDSYVDDYTDALDHSYEAVVTAPTYEAQGYTTYTCTVCGHSYEGDFVPALVYHEVLEGEDAQWSPESGEPVSVHVDADIANFVEVRLNGELLDEECYTLTEGSTIVVLKPEYLATLPAGEHTLELLFTDGSAEVTFEILSPAVTLGDVNEDGKIDTVDAFFIVAYYNKVRVLTADQLLAADVDANGRVDTVDAYYIVALYNKVIDTLPAAK